MEKCVLRWLGMMLFVAFVVPFIHGTTEAWAGKNESAFEKKLQGNWELVSLINELDGKKSEPFEANPIGSLSLTPDGNFFFNFHEK